MQPLSGLAPVAGRADASTGLAALHLSASIRLCGPCYTVVGVLLPGWMRDSLIVLQFSQPAGDDVGIQVWRQIVQVCSDYE